MGDAKETIEKIARPNSRDWWKMEVLHVIRGCEKMPHWVIVDDKMVEVGKICPVCLTEYPLDGR